MTKKYPIDNQWQQLNLNDRWGSLAMSRNIDLDDVGRLRLAKRTKYIGQTTSGNFTDAYAIEFYKSYYYVASGRLFRVSESETPVLSEVTVTPGPPVSQTTDLCVWDDNLYVAGTTRVGKFDGTTWTTSWSGTDFATTSTDTIHPITPNVTNSNILAGDYNLLKTIDSDGTVATAITFPSNMVVRWIRQGLNVNYIGLENISGTSDGGRGGAVAVWDGLATTLGWNQLFYTSECPMAGAVDDNGILICFFADGRLMRFNGSGFSRLSELPVYRDKYLSGSWGGSISFGHKIFPKGMQIIDGKVYLSINANLASSVGMVSKFQGGLWVYDPEIDSFYLKYTPSSYNTDTDDFGESFITSMGAVYPVLAGGNFIMIQPSSDKGGEVFFGSRGTVGRSMLSVTTGFNIGQFVLTKTESPVITNKNIKIACKFSGLSGDNDKIVFKYKTEDRDPVGAFNIEWTSTTICTTSGTNAANLEAGDEITIISGKGAGGTSHISTISESGGTYTITIDEAITGVSASDSGWAVGDNFKRLSTEITKDDTLGYKIIPIIPTTNSTWIQIKCEMRGEGHDVVIDGLDILTTEDKGVV